MARIGSRFRAFHLLALFLVLSISSLLSAVHAAPLTSVSKTTSLGVTSAKSQRSTKIEQRALPLLTKEDLTNSDVLALHIPIHFHAHLNTIGFLPLKKPALIAARQRFNKFAGHPHNHLWRSTEDIAIYFAGLLGIPEHKVTHEMGIAASDAAAQAPELHADAETKMFATWGSPHDWSQKEGFGLPPNTAKALLDKSAGGRALGISAMNVEATNPTQFDAIRIANGDYHYATWDSVESYLSHHKSTSLGEAKDPLKGFKGTISHLNKPHADQPDEGLPEVHHPQEQRPQKPNKPKQQGHQTEEPFFGIGDPVNPVKAKPNGEPKAPTGPVELGGGSRVPKNPSGPKGAPRSKQPPKVPVPVERPA